MKLLFLFVIVTFVSCSVVTADTNFNFNFAGMIPAPAVPSPTDEPTCPSPTPPVCPVEPSLQREEPEVEEYFSLDTSVQPHQIKAEFFHIFRPEGDESVTGSDEQVHKKRGAIVGCQAPITYRGGPVMSGPNVAYFIYYGAFSSFHPNGTNTATNKTKSLLTQFVSGISNHAWYNISTEYFSRFFPLHLSCAYLFLSVSIPRIPVIVSKTWVWQFKYVPSTIAFGGTLRLALLHR